MGIKSPTVHCFQKPGQWLRSIYFLACSRLSFIGGNTKGANIKAGAHLFANNITSTVSVHLNFESGPWLEDLQSSQSWPQTVRHWQTLFPKKKKHLPTEYLGNGGVPAIDSVIICGDQLKWH